MSFYQFFIQKIIYSSFICLTLNKEPLMYFNLYFKYFLNNASTFVIFNTRFKSLECNILVNTCSAVILLKSTGSHMYSPVTQYEFQNNMFLLKSFVKLMYFSLAMKMH